jgi:hypothetical protein
MAIVNITVQNDADLYQLFQYVSVNPDGSIGQPINMTGASLEMMLRRHASDETAVLRLATDSGEFVLTDPTDGYFTLKVVQSVLEQLGLGSFDQSNIMTLGGLKTSVWRGTFVINPGPTR